MAHVERIGGIMIRAADVDAMAAWYETALGVVLDVEANGGRYGILSTDAGDLNVGIAPRPANMHRGAPTVALTFRVADFDAHLARIRAARLFIREELQDDEGRFAYLRDPEGNEIALWGD